jgi:dihydrofolate reductase
MISMILAADTNGGIGKNNTMPWEHISEDMKHFQRTTNNNVVVMGTNTWDSLGNIAPLKNRINYVISTQEAERFTGVYDVYDYSKYSIKDIITAIQSRHPDKEVIIIGGKTLYDVTYDLCDTIHLTRIIGEFDCDTVVDINEYLDNFECAETRINEESKHPTIQIERWVRV